MGDNNYDYDDMTQYGLCPSWALSLGYMGVAAGAVLSNWGSAVSYESQAKLGRWAAGVLSNDAITKRGVGRDEQGEGRGYIAVLVPLKLLTPSSILYLTNRRTMMNFRTDVQIYVPAEVGNLEEWSQPHKYGNSPSWVSDEECHSGGHGGR